MNERLNAIIMAVDRAWFAPGEIDRCWDFERSCPHDSCDGGFLELFIVQEIYESDGESTNWVASAINDLHVVRDAIKKVLNAIESSNESN